MTIKTKAAIVFGMMGLISSIAAAAAPTPCKGHVNSNLVCVTPPCVIGQTCCDCGPT
jgi:hypothetical protein